MCLATVENLSLFALIYLWLIGPHVLPGWESFIIRLDILTAHDRHIPRRLRIFHYSPWYTYCSRPARIAPVENLSLFALIYLRRETEYRLPGWESFIIRLDILTRHKQACYPRLRIFHYSPWYTYKSWIRTKWWVENLSLFALIYLLATK